MEYPYNIKFNACILSEGWEEQRATLKSTRGTVAGLGYESTNPKRLVRELAIDAEATRHGGADGCWGGRGAALTLQAELEGRQASSSDGSNL